jgi:hypothetical protein
MNMKRGLVFTLCALALAASGSVAHAQLGATDIALSLNLRYTNPANPASGGTWYLVARTGSADGIAGVSAFIQNINTAGMLLGNGGVAANGYAAVSSTDIGSIVQTAPNSPYNGTFSGFVNVVYGQNTSVVENGSIKLDVGNGGAPGLIALDPLKNATWNNSALLASGTFAGTRPVFGTAGTTTTAGNVLPVGATATPPQNTALAATNMSGANLVVRGDTERSLGVEGVNLGLWAGDANRDGTVNSSDLSLLLTNFNGTGKTWDQGNFNNTAGTPDTIVNSSDLSLLLTNFNKVASPISVAAVPEPGSAVLVVGAFAALLARRRRSSTSAR